MIAARAQFRGIHSRPRTWLRAAAGMSALGAIPLERASPRALPMLVALCAAATAATVSASIHSPVVSSPL